MWNQTIRAVMYYEWFIQRDIFRRDGNSPWTRYQIGIIPVFIFSLTVGSIFGIFYFSTGIKLPRVVIQVILYGAAIGIITLVTIGSSRREELFDEFKKIDKHSTKKYDRYVWAFTLFTVGALITMLVLSPR